jgi:hypothetical protein
MPGSPPDQDLPAIVLARAGQNPEEPVLFYPDGLDVRWRSWAELAEQVAGGASGLSGLGLAPGSPVGFRWRTEPDAVAADLAIQAAGFVPVPVAEAAEVAAAGCGVRLLLPEEPAPAEALPAVRLPVVPRHRRAAPGRAAVPAARSATGSLGTAGAALESARRLAERLDRAAADVAAAVPGGRRQGREIAVASFDLRTASGRTFLAWALGTGSALFLEPDPRALPGSAAWARPTLVAGPARSLVELGQHVRRLGELDRRWLHRRRPGPRLPFGRLRLLLILDDGRLPVDDVAFWAGRGVAVLRIDRE